MLDMENHPNWFDASYISWLSYDSLNIELPDGYLFFAPIVNWGKYREENGRLVMPVSVRLNHAIADGYLLANVFRLLERDAVRFAADRPYVFSNMTNSTARLMLVYQYRK